jgi:hypothetical protein
MAVLGDDSQRNNKGRHVKFCMGIDDKHILLTYLLTYLLTHLLLTYLLLTYLLTYSLITYLLTYLLTYSLITYLPITYLLTYSLITYLLTHLLLTYLFTYLLTPWCRILFEKLIVTQLVKQYPAFFMETEGSFPCSQKPATGHYSESDESSSSHRSLSP